MIFTGASFEWLGSLSGRSRGEAERSLTSKMAPCRSNDEGLENLNGMQGSIESIRILHTDKTHNSSRTCKLSGGSRAARRECGRSAWMWQLTRLLHAFLSIVWYNLAAKLDWQRAAQCSTWTNGAITILGNHSDLPGEWWMPTLSEQYVHSLAIVQQEVESRTNSNIAFCRGCAENALSSDNPVAFQSAVDEKCLRHWQNAWRWGGRRGSRGKLLPSWWGLGPATAHQRLVTSTSYTIATANDKLKQSCEFLLWESF